MLILLFEVTPKPDRMQDYLDTAAKLKPELEASGGCLFIERYRSLTDAAKVLSFQVWRDEAAMTKWRTNGIHHKAQTLGRTQIFADYRLRVAQVLREEEPGKPAWQAVRLNTYNDPAHRPPRHVMVVQSTAAAFAAEAGKSVEGFTSLYREGQFLHLVEIDSLQAGLDVSENCRVGAPAYLYRLCEVERDYGMFERGEAAQYYPDLKRPA